MNKCLLKWLQLKQNVLLCVDAVDAEELPALLKGVVIFRVYDVCLPATE